MRLLLTSSGITNPSIARALKKWVKAIRIAFIPTAANALDDDKEWLIKNFVECRRLGPVDIVDISALKKSNWLPRLKKANVIVVGGGWTDYLQDHIISSGLKEELPRLLRRRVYVGISAGSIVTAKKIGASSDWLYGDETQNAPVGLGLVDFNIRPHLNSKQFPRVRNEYLKKVSKKMNGDLYALDDDSAVSYDNGRISIVSEGTWKLYKK